MIANVLVLVIVLGEWTGAARALLGSPIYAGALDGGLVVLAGLSVARWLRGGRRRMAVSALDVLVVAYIALATIQLLNPNVPNLLTGLEGFRKTAFTMLGYVMIRLSPPADPSRWLSRYVLGSAPAFALAIVVFLFPSSLSTAIINSAGTSPMSFHSGPVLRAFVPTAGPFHLGMLAGLALSIAFVLHETRARSTISGYLGVATISGVALALTLTRANMIAGIGALGLTALLVAWGPALRSKARLAIVVRAGVLALLVVAVAITVARTYPVVAPPLVAPPHGGSAPPTVVAPAESQPVVGNLNPLDDRSMQYRFQYWATFIDSIATRPVVGYGTSSAADGFGRLYEGTGKQNFEPHSIYLKSTLELGLGGLVLIVGILVLAVVSAVRHQERNRAVATVIIATVAFTAVTGVTGPMLDAYPANLLFWAILGLGGSPPSDADAAPVEGLTA